MLEQSLALDQNTCGCHDHDILPAKPFHLPHQAFNCPGPSHATCTIGQPKTTFRHLFPSSRLHHTFVPTTPSPVAPGAPPPRSHRFRSPRRRSRRLQQGAAGVPGRRLGGDLGLGRGAGGRGVSAGRARLHGSGCLAFQAMKGG